MKKLALLLVVSATVAGCAFANDPSKVTVDLTELRVSTKEGQRLEKTRQQKLDEFRKYASQKEQEVASAEQMLLKKHQQGELTPNDLQREMGQLDRKKRLASAEIEDKKLELSMQIQEEDRKHEAKILKTIPEIAKENGWKQVIDKSSGTVLFAATELDKTTDMLSALNKKFDAEKAVAGAKKTLKA